MKNKRNIILNILFLLCEIIGLVLTLVVTHSFQFEYYTEDSNLFAFIVGIIYLCYLILNKKIPRWLQILRLSSIIGLVLTCVVVFFVLLPMTKFNIGYMFGGANFFLHLTCPLLMKVIHFLDKKKIRLNNKELIISCIPTAIYSVILILLNIFNIIKGPYPFLYVYEQPIYVSILWFLFFGITVYLFSILLNKKKRRVNKH